MSGKQKIYEKIKYRMKEGKEGKRKKERKKVKLWCQTWVKRWTTEDINYESEGKIAEKRKENRKKRETTNLRREKTAHNEEVMREGLKQEVRHEKEKGKRTG